MPRPQTFSVTREFRAPVRRLWEILANTNRLNRAIGLGAVDYAEVQADEQGDFYQPASSRIAGISLSWREYPFEWQKEEFFSVRRDHEHGPLECMLASCRFKALDEERTELTLEATITPRNVLGRAFAAKVAHRSFLRTLEYCESAGSFGIKKAIDRETHPTFLNQALLTRHCNQLSALKLLPDSIVALRTLLENAPDEDVTALRPYKWADRNGLDRPEALRTCLHAVKVGLLTLQWSLLCPNCRVSKSEATTLAEVSGQVHCDLCGLSFDVNFDQYVELRFAVHPAVRTASSAIFCLSGPHATPHILWQRHLIPGQMAEVPEVNETQPLQLRVLRKNKISPPAPHARLSFDGDKWMEGVDPAGTIHNACNDPIVVVLERVLWESGAVTAAEVTTLQEFRDLFASEVLLPGRQIGVECLTLLFTDLGNSTALYERIGDAVAYGRVGAHFDFMQEIISEHQGAVVKTMGDAVMAVFHRTSDALRAALQLQREFPSFAARHAELGDVYLKLGVHTGPALAVNQNDKLDYFGRTVNVAARLVAAAAGPEIIVSEGLLDDTALVKMVNDEGIEPEAFRQRLRGVEGETELWRLRARGAEG